MFAMLVVVAALIRFNSVHSRATNEDVFGSEHIAKIFTEDDMTPDFAEQLGRHDHTRDIQKRNNDGREVKFGRPHNGVRPAAKPVVVKQVNYTTARNQSESNAIRRNTPGFNTLGHNVSGQNESGGEEKRQISHDYTDVVDREDHVTQYLSDQLINTDNEITSLQASEVEDDRVDGLEVTEDSFFAFLTGLEKVVDVEGAWSRSVDEDLLPNSEDQVNGVSEVEYKD